MPVFDDPAVRASTATDAAVSAARELGLDVIDPRVLYDAFSVIVDLRPQPVVVRVPTVLSDTARADPDAQTRQQRMELDVTRWLSERGFPVVRPSPLVPLKPVPRDGFSMTFWVRVEEVPDQDGSGPAARADLTARLHAELREYDEPLDYLGPIGPFITDGVDWVQGRDEVLTPELQDRAAREWAVLKPVTTSREAFEDAFPTVAVQPIHGDAPTYNVIDTPAGPICSDFENVCLGPVESDLALLDDVSLQAYSAAAMTHGGRPIDDRALAVMSASRMLQVVACLALAPQLPMLVDGLKPSLRAWQDMPFAGGLEH